MNYGFIKPKLEDKQFVLGALGQSLPKIVICPDGQWDSFLPSVEFQRNEFTDSYNCTAYGSENCWEILLKAKYNETHDFGERALGIWAGTYPPGNDPHIVCETARKRGLTPDTMLPFTASIKNVDEYYNLNGLDTLLDTAGRLWLSRNTLNHEWVFSGDLSLEEQRTKMVEALKYSPLGVAVYAWQKEGDVYVRKGEDTHWTVVYGYHENGDWKCLDSYNGTLKRLDKNFGFTYVKRFHVEKKIEKKTIKMSVSRLTLFLKWLFK